MNNAFEILMFWTGVLCWLATAAMCCFVCLSLYVHAKDAQESEYRQGEREADFDASEHEANGQIQDRIARGQL